jgi:hypothetical protein
MGFLALLVENQYDYFLQRTENPMNEILEAIEMARKKPALSPELKELVTTHIAVLSKEDFNAFERYIIELRKERVKVEKDLPKIMDQLKVMGYKITKSGEEKKPESTAAVEALKEIVKPEEKKPAEVKSEEKKTTEAKGTSGGASGTAKGGGWPL